MEDLIKKNKRFFDKISKYYDFRLFKKWQESVKKVALEMIDIKNNSKILDAGCGTGSLLSMLKKLKPSTKLYGIDISPKMLKIAKKKVKSANLKLSSVEEINKKEFYDHIFSSDAFHHYENQNMAMQNFYKALKQEGHLTIIDFDFGIFNYLLHKIEPGNSKMNSSSDFKNLFKEHGFYEIKQKRVSLVNIITIGKKNKNI